MEKLYVSTPAGKRLLRHDRRGDYVQIGGSPVYLTGGARTKLTARGVVPPARDYTIDELKTIADHYGVYVPKGATKSEIFSNLLLNAIFKKMKEDGYEP